MTDSLNKKLINFYNAVKFIKKNLLIYTKK